jgi:hypothetical protein
MAKHQTSSYKQQKDAQKAQARKDMRSGKIKPGNSPSPAYRTPTKKK